MPVAKHRHKIYKHSRARRKLHSKIATANADMLKQIVQQAAEEKLPDRERGLYSKWQARRIDGSSEPGGKHQHCELFILDLNHDPHAIPALFSYATSARADGYELLAGNLFAKIQPYLDKLHEQAMLAEPELTFDQQAAIATMTDTDLLHAVNMGAWVETDDPVAHHQLEELMDRFKKLTSKPKRVTRKKKTNAADTDSTKEEAA